MVLYYCCISPFRFHGYLLLIYTFHSRLLLFWWFWGLLSRLSYHKVPSNKLFFIQRPSWIEYLNPIWHLLNAPVSRCSSWHLIHHKFRHFQFRGCDILSARAAKCEFLGYSRVQMGYWSYAPSTHRFYVSANVTFFDDTPFLRITNYIRVYNRFYSFSGTTYSYIFSIYLYNHSTSQLRSDLKLAAFVLLMSVNI